MNENLNQKPTPPVDSEVVVAKSVEQVPSELPTTTSVNGNVFNDKLTIILCALAIIVIALVATFLLSQVRWKRVGAWIKKLFSRHEENVQQNLTGDIQGAPSLEDETQNAPMPGPMPVEKKPVPPPPPKPMAQKKVPAVAKPSAAKPNVEKPVSVKKTETPEEIEARIKKAYEDILADYEKQLSDAAKIRDKAVEAGKESKEQELRGEFEIERKKLQGEIKGKNDEISRVRASANEEIQNLKNEKSAIETRWQKKLNDELAQKDDEISRARKEAESQIQSIEEQKSKIEKELEAEKERSRQAIETEQNRSRKALEEEQARSRKVIATEQERSREALAEKDREILRERKICSDVLAKMWPDFNSVPEVAEVFKTWESEIKSKAEAEISPAVKGILARLFVWKAAVAMKDEKQQQNALVEFTRSFFVWANAIGKSPKDAENDARKIAKLFNETLIPAAGSAYKIYLPEVNAPYDAARTQPALSSKSKFGRIVALESCGILSSANKILSKANVMLV